MISLCLTNYNRTDLLYRSFEQVINDDRISEIVISDDHSRDDIYQSVVWKYNGVDKVKIFRNTENLDCYRNKRQAVKRATNEWVILFDSDNILTKNYIDKIFEGEDGRREWDPTILFAPSFARPHFDFRALAGKVITRSNISALIDIGNCSTMLNAMNYFVNREEFLRVWGLSGSTDPVTSDSLFQNYNWLKGGNSIFVVPGMEYEHLIHDGSHYQNNIKRTPHGFHDSIIEKLKNMK